MKTLILLRHAKSDWKSEVRRDHDRPLNRRGHRAAATVGKFLDAIGEVPGAVVASSAIRARTTAEEAAKSGGWHCSVEVSADLYETSPAMVLDLIHRRNDVVDSLLLAGHEPTWSRLVSELIGGGTVSMVTAAMVRIDFDVPRWKEVQPGLGSLVWAVSPRLLEKLEASSAFSLRN